MDQNEESLLRENGLAFFGSIVAAQSHEINNVLTIIKELSGLQEDLLSAEVPDHPADTGRLRQISGRIRKQVERGETIIRNMNRFAHSVDSPTAVLDLREVLERIVFLTRRQARLKKATLEERYPGDPVPLQVNTFALEQAVFTCIEAALAATGSRRRVTVGYRVCGEDAEVEVASADPIHPGPGLAAKQELLALLMKALGGKVVAAPGEGAHRFTLLIPRQGGKPG